MKELSEKVDLIVDSIIDEVIEVRQYIHKHPELSLEEYETSKFIRQQLSPLKSIELIEPLMETDVIGLINKESNGKNITLRADIDALPMTELNQCEYKSVNENIMHACGHDGHTAILIGTAMVLNEISEQLNGSVKLVFQPGEEGKAGGHILVNAGVLDIAPKSDICFGLHGFGGVPVGTVASKPGYMTAACDHFEITVNGVGGHGAMPELSNNPLLPAAQIVTSLNGIANNNVSGLESAVVSVCCLNAGAAENVIPDKAVIKGTIRSFDKDIQCKVHEKVNSIANGLAQAYGCKSDVIIEKGYIASNNDINAYELFKKVAGNTLGEGATLEVPKPLMGSEDFSFFLDKVPGCLFVLGLGEETASLHSPNFNFNDKAIKTGIKMFVNLVIDYLNKEDKDD